MSIALDKSYRHLPKLEEDVEAYLVKRVKEVGGLTRKVKWPGVEGAPDRLVMLPGVRSQVFSHYRPDRTIWVELKRPGGKAKFPKNEHERKQHREHERMRKMGQRVEIIDSFEGVDELLEE